MRFGDGYALWAWHGVRVSQAVIEHPDRLTLSDIHQETNTERRRVMIERWGWDSISKRPTRPCEMSIQSLREPRLAWTVSVP